MDAYSIYDHFQGMFIHVTNSRYPQETSPSMSFQMSVQNLVKGVKPWRNTRSIFLFLEMPICFFMVFEGDFTNGTVGIRTQASLFAYAVGDG